MRQVAVNGFYSGRRLRINSAGHPIKSRYFDRSDYFLQVDCHSMYYLLCECILLIWISLVTYVMKLTLTSAY